MRLHNRQIKATFWTDPDLLQWTRDKRVFYIGLAQLADDSGCIEDSPFAFKINLFPSPLDSDINVEIINQWRNEMIDEGKLIPYQEHGKSYLFLVNFHKHQTLDKPTPPSKASIPLPPWVIWVKGDTRNKSYYQIKDMPTTCTGQVPDKEGACSSRTGTGTITGTITGTTTITTTPPTENRESEFNPEELESRSRQVVERFEKGFGRPLNPIEAERIQYWLEQHSAELIEHALDIAVLGNNRSCKYISGILTNWNDKGVKCVQDVEDLEKRHQEQKKQAAGQQFKNRASPPGGPYEFYVPPEVLEELKRQSG